MDNTRVQWALFEQRLSFYVLRAIGEHPMSTKTDIMRLEPGFEKTKFERINMLIENGYVELRKVENYSTARLILTDKGKFLFDKIREIEDVRFDVEEETED